MHLFEIFVCGVSRSRLWGQYLTIGVDRLHSFACKLRQFNIFQQVSAGCSESFRLFIPLFGSILTGLSASWLAEILRVSGSPAGKHPYKDTPGTQLYHIILQSVDIISVVHTVHSMCSLLAEDA